jgi:hypothetical protein
MSKKFPLPVGTRVRMKNSGASGELGTVRDPYIYQIEQDGGATPQMKLRWTLHPKERPGQDFFDQGWVSVKWDDGNTHDGFLPETLEVVESAERFRLRDWLTT